MQYVDMIISCESRKRITHAQLASGPCRAFRRGTFAGLGMGLHHCEMKIHMFDNRSAIYSITHVASGKEYVGSALKLKNRLKFHLHCLRYRYHHNRHLQNAFNKYGEKAFRVEIIELVEKAKMLIVREQFHLDCRKPKFNFCKTAGSCLGRIVSSETRAKMGAAWKGRKHKPESIELMRLASTGKIFTEETRAKLRASRALRNIRFPHLSEHLSKLFKGRIRSKETLAKASKSLKGHSCTPEGRIKMSLAKLGKPWTKARRESHNNKQMKVSII